MSESSSNFDLNSQERLSPTAQTFRQPQRTLWAIGGGKGGIGKTLLTSNMAVYLSRQKKRVVVVDLDLGAANLHTSLGVANPDYTLSDLILGKVKEIADIVQPTRVPNLGLISGAQNNMGMSNIRFMHKKRLIRKFKDIDADIVLLDLGAGTNFNTLDFFLLAQKKLVVMTPEPTSIENGYRFIKAAFYRLIRSSTESPYIRQIIESAMDLKNQQAIATPRDLIAYIKQISPIDGQGLQNSLTNFSMDLALNQVRNRNEAEIGHNIQLVCERYFGLRLNYAGFLPYDKVVWQSVRNQVPFVQEAPHSMASVHFDTLMRSLLQGEED